MPGKIEITMNDAGGLDLQSTFDLANTVLALERVKAHLVAQAGQPQQQIIPAAALPLFGGNGNGTPRR